jgi:hypothetical protein
MLLTARQKARIATLAVIQLEAAITRGPQMASDSRILDNYLGAGPSTPSHQQRQ